jgi:cohesin loading factor subunit SCC2
MVLRIQGMQSDISKLLLQQDIIILCSVSSAIVQRYLSQILDAALSQSPQIQATAIDVLSFTIKQGLAHPLQVCLTVNALPVHQLRIYQSFPVIVALETSPMPNLSNRASALHAILHGKHASLLNTRYTTSARAAFDYQRKVSSGAIQGIIHSPHFPIIPGH